MIPRDTLPNLLIAGVPKAGTTALFEYLAQHPEICPSREKEPGFFIHLRDGLAPRMSLAEYVDLFADCPREVTYRMEATARYFFGGGRLIEGILATLPDPHVIVSLREPVERLWSAYWSQTYSRRMQAGEIRNGLDPDLDSFLARCEAVSRSLVEPTRGHPDWVAMRLFQGGLYADWLRDWLGAFGPRLRVVFFDDIRSDPAGLTRNLLTWLELDSRIPLDVGVRNRTVSPRSEALHRIAQLVRRTARLRTRAPRLDATLTRLYERLNTTPGARRALDEHTRQRIHGLYAESNREVARTLREHGYTSLPTWLHSTHDRAQTG